MELSSTSPERAPITRETAKASQESGSLVGAPTGITPHQVKNEVACEALCDTPVGAPCDGSQVKLCTTNKSLINQKTINGDTEASERKIDRAQHVRCSGLAFKMGLPMFDLYRQAGGPQAAGELAMAFQDGSLPEDKIRKILKPA